LKVPELEKFHGVRRLIGPEPNVKSEVPMLALRDLMRPIGDHNAMQPACPICSRQLRLTRVTPRDGDLAELRTYGCTGCGVWLTEAAED
jgi:hypothetical protein